MNWQNGSAIYKQIIDKFKKDIILGNYVPGCKIMSVREYASILCVNPNTIVKVYDILENEGLIESKSTNGYFLTSDVKIINSIKPEFAKEYLEEFVVHMKSIGYSKEEAIKLLKESD